MNIKKCTYNDIPQLADIALRSYREHYTHLWHDNGEWYMQSRFNYDKLHEEMTDPDAAFFLVYTEQKITGFIKLNIDKATDNFSAAESMELERIYFIKEASGRGAGKHAMNFIIDIAKQKNKKLLWLKAMDSSPAVEFYKKQGFAITGETWLDFIEMKDEYKRMFIMYLPLDNG